MPSPVVPPPRDIREAIVYDSRHNIHVLLEHGSGVDGERGTGLIARHVLNGVKL